VEEWDAKHKRDPSDCSKDNKYELEANSFGDKAASNRADSGACQQTPSNY